MGEGHEGRDSVPWKQQLKGEARTGLREKKLRWACSHRQLLSSTLNVPVEGQLPPVGTPGGQMGQFSFSLLIREWTSRDKYKQTRTVASALLIVSEAGTGHNGGGVDTGVPPPWHTSSAA